MAMNQQWPSLADLPDETEIASETTAAFDPETASVSELLFAGLRIARSGGFDDAAEIFAKAILKDPESAEAYEALATVLVPLGKIEFASRAKAKAISLGYNSAQSWDMLGEMLVSLRKFDDAADAFKTALDLEPTSTELEYKLEAARVRGLRSKALGTASHSKAEADIFGSEFLSADPVPPAWQSVSIVTIVPAGNPHSAAFDDLVLGFESALRALGVSVSRRINSFAETGINILFGAHLLASQDEADSVPANTVVVNLEQVTGFDVKGRPAYFSLLKRLAIWDYSVRNIVELRRLTQNPLIRHFSVGYVPEMTRRIPSFEQPVDVLFYGSTNPRRIAVLQGLAKAGLNVKHMFSVYGSERDQAIAEAKVVLNVHFYEDSIHEIVRTSYLLANSKAVVSECGPKTEIDEDIRHSMFAVPYEDLVQACVMLVRDESRRRELERQAFATFVRRDQVKILRDTIAATVLPEATV
ncbi:tetratricopeptide repeat protein [Hyphomicrobium sp. B1]|uniref:tetratricopeptide repeat protein n=1 Tax=Hyphomicrobium sp. B1 TaxID=3075651 RepID=UPI003C30BCF1